MINHYDIVLSSLWHHLQVYGCTLLLAANLNEGGAVSLSVEDNGPGIAAADISRVLEPFGRVREHPEHAKEGTGLGLSLSKKMAELHGGDLSLESTFGRGTKVVVSLPPERTLEEDNKTHPATALPGPL